MRKISLILIAISLVFVACSQKESTRYIIEGIDIPSEYINDSIIIVTTDSLIAPWTELGRLPIIDGKFTLEGDAMQQSMGVVLVQKKGEEIVTLLSNFVLEPGTIRLSLGDNWTRGGTPANDRYQQIEEMKKLYQTSVQKDFESVYPTVKDDPVKLKEYEEKVKIKEEEYVVNMKAYLEENISTPFGVMLFRDYYYNMEPNENLNFISRMPAYIQNSIVITEIKEEVTKQLASSIGQKYTDLKGKTMDGKDLALSDIAGKGKYVLVDFWASWCGPCIGELPTLRKAYANYKDKGFEIFSVSCDEDHEEWKKASKEHNIVWSQIVDNENSDLSNAYGVGAIPFTILIDKEGIIIEKNLRGDALIRKLEELIKK